MDVHEFVKKFSDLYVVDAIYKANREIELHDDILCSISGGSDSDIMLDLLSELGANYKTTYVWFDTGLEYDATKRHLKELENKYNVHIVPLKAKKPIPIVCNTYGQPFLSKQVSENIARLQKHNFKWEDKPFEELYKEYPKCKVALRWWCNDWGEGSRFNISYNTWLKEFMIENPPTFKTSNKCCSFAKKNVAKDYIANGSFDLNCVGVRKSEGGARAGAYKNCFTPSENGEIDQYRPIFWFDDASKQHYKEIQKIQNSDCYEVWGLKRTGCAACPFGRNYEYELKCIEQYEPKFYKAVNKIFGKSYEYTRKYREFQKRMKSDKNATLS